MEAWGFLPPLEPPFRLIEGFKSILAKRTTQKREIERTLIIFRLTKDNPSQVAKHLKRRRKTCYRWYHRTKELIAVFEKNPVRADVELERFLHLFLKDKMHTGAPLIYTPEQQCAIVAMATEKPEKYGIQSSKWTHWELAMVANRNGIIVVRQTLIKITDHYDEA